MKVVDRIDRFQRRHAVVGMPLAVIYKFFDDRGAYQAALITYYGFLSLFPLLLIFTSALGFFVGSNGHLHDELVNSALADFPIVGGQLRSSVGSYHGSGAALVVGVLGTLYGGLGATQAAQAAFNTIYAVPRNEQPNPFMSRLRSFGLLLLLGTFILLSTGLGTMVSTVNSISAQLGGALSAAAYLLTFVVDVALFTAAFQLLTARDLHIRQVLTGGIIAGSAWMVLQTAGTAYMAHKLAHTNEVYGSFGVVLAAIAWIYLESLVLIAAAEINVVLHLRLYPRALLTPFTDNVDLTTADRRCYEMYVITQRFKGFQRVRTSFRKGRPVPKAGTNGHDGGARPADGYLEVDSDGYVDVAPPLPADQTSTASGGRST